MMFSPRSGAKFCWVMTIVSFIIAGIGLYETMTNLVYIALGMVVLFMIILPLFVCRCPYCRQKIPTRGMIYIKKCPYCGKEIP